MVGRWILLAVLGLSVLGLTACAASTPGCDRAAALLSTARLEEAAVTYAEADAQGEGDCAASGRASAESAFGDAAADVARGRAAEGEGDVAGAVSAYQAALGLDGGNAAARDGLTRLRAAPPAVRPVAAPPARVPVTVSVPWWPFVVAGVLLVAVLAACWWWTRTVLATVPARPSPGPAPTRATGPEDGIRDGLAGIERRLDTLARDDAAARGRIESRLDGIADQLDDDARDRPAEHRRFVRPE